jgi:hypothetical protein
MRSLLLLLVMKVQYILRLLNLANVLVYSFKTLLHKYFTMLFSQQNHFTLNRFFSNLHADFGIYYCRSNPIYPSMTNEITNSVHYPFVDHHSIDHPVSTLMQRRCNTPCK